MNKLLAEENSVVIEELDDYLPGLDESIRPKPAVKKEPFFIWKFVTTPGCLRLLCVTLLVSASIGTTAGLIQEVMSDRYARLDHGYTGKSCDKFSHGKKPQECLLGEDDARDFAAWSNFAQYSLLFFLSPVVGSISDTTGRKQLFIFGILLQTLPQLFLVLHILIKPMNPAWYYAASGCTGLVGWLPIAFAAISDIMPGDLRAPSFGLVLTSRCLGASAAPYLAAILSHFLISITSLAIAMVTVIYVFLFVPETLSYEISAASEVMRRRNDEDGIQLIPFLQVLSRPFRDLSILNRNKFFRIVSGVTFLTGFTYSTDHSFILYYLENHLNFTDSDASRFLLVKGAFAILVNGILLRHLIRCFGEKYILIVAILFGTVHNILYGIAGMKILIFVAVSLSSLTTMSYPIIASMQSFNCADYEQGQIQGAFFSLNSLANAFGPILLIFIYNWTKDGGVLGHGTLFFVVSFMYVLALFVAFAIPAGDANSNEKNTIGATDLNKLLLEDNPSEDDSASVDSRVEFF